MRNTSEDMAESGGDWLTLDLRDFPQWFRAASDIQRDYGLSDSAVRKACEAGRVRAWQLGGTWIVYLPDAQKRWGKRLK